jgi:hypothetical protein
MVNWHIGCSGFHYKIGKGRFTLQTCHNANGLIITANILVRWSLMLLFIAFRSYHFYKTGIKKRPQISGLQ